MMATTTTIEPTPLPVELPSLPIPPSQFLQHVAGNPQFSVRNLVKPFRQYEAALRAYFAQAPEHEFVADGMVNLVDMYGEHSVELKAECRDLEKETGDVKDLYMMQLDETKRKKSGERVIQPDLKSFRDNFNVFTEGALLNLDWSNIIVAGSAVLTPLLTVPDTYTSSKRTLRDWYHEHIAPASDIDLFLHGLKTEEEAIAKIAAIEATVKNNLLWETTTIRTRNTITILSQYPNRHVQIVLRLYRSIPEILTGFDVDCSAFAYDGSRVLASPRALAAVITQCNDIDLTRRSPSYENRLSKYAQRGFEVYCDFLERSRIDPSIFERSFSRTVGLARLLVLEALPKPEMREAYTTKRREEMGRPVAWKARSRLPDKKNKKENETNEVAEWDFEDVSGYQRFVIPYGPNYNARKIEKLFFKKDLLLNAEWNKMNRPPHRSVKLHRHPVFFGTVADVVGDCCGFCPEPLNDEEKAIAEEENKTYVHGPIKFLSDDPGRQEIGSFNPLGPEDYTDMAYVGSTQRLCEAIVDNDLEFVKEWCQTNVGDVNARDFCGRTPLQLACMSGSTEIEIVKCLIDNGARLIARLQDGRTALHIAAARGRADMVAALLTKSAENEHKRDILKASASRDVEDVEMKEAGDSEEESEDDDSDAASETSFDSIHRSDAETKSRAETTTTGGFVKVKSEENALDQTNDKDSDDIYDINITDWDYMMSPLHHAVLLGNSSVIEVLVSEFGADIRKAITHRDERYYNVPHYLTLVFALRSEDPVEAISKLLKLGATCTQVTTSRDGARTTAFQYLSSMAPVEILQAIFKHEAPGAASVINSAFCNAKYTHSRWAAATPLTSAMATNESAVDVAKFLIEKGAHVNVTGEDIIRNMKPAIRQQYSAEVVLEKSKEIRQPLEQALEKKNKELIRLLIENGANVDLDLNGSYNRFRNYDGTLNPNGMTPLDWARNEIETGIKAIEGLDPSSRKSNYTHWHKPHADYDDDVVLQFQEGSYRRAVAERHLESCRRSNKYWLENSKQNVDKDWENTLKKRKEAKKDLDDMLEIESMLVRAGAKTFHEVHPELLEDYLKERGSGAGPESWRMPRKEPIDIPDIPDTVQKYPTKQETFDPFNFKVPYLGDGDAKEGYLRLFDAIWSGDVETVKKLTSGPTEEGDSLIPALRMAIEDGEDVTPLMLSVLRGDEEMSKLILEIIQQQYEAVPQKPERPHDVYLSDDDEMPSDDEDNNDEDAGAELDLVKNHTCAWNFFLQTHIIPDQLLPSERVDDASFSEMLEAKNATSSLKNWSPLSFAIYRNSQPMINSVLRIARFAIELCPDLNAEHELWSWVIANTDWPTRRVYHNLASNAGKYRAFPFPAHVDLAMKLARIDVLEFLMSTFSFGIPYDELNVKEEAIKKTAQKLYKGLSIRGAKDKNWVSSSFPSESDSEADKRPKPLYTAAHYGRLESVIWLQSDRPAICLQQFITSNPTSDHVRLLQTHGGTDLLSRGLGLTTNQLLHISLHGWQPESPFSSHKAVISHLIDQLESRTTAGLTPCLFAARLHNPEALAFLLSLGANFAVRDNTGRNILHHILTPHDATTHVGVQQLQPLLDVIPADIKATAWKQRGIEGCTPLMRYIIRAAGISDEPLRYILTASEGFGLDLADSTGNLAIHYLMLKRRWAEAKILLEFYPGLVEHENGNGKTPREILEQQMRDMCVEHFPEVRVEGDYRHSFIVGAENSLKEMGTWGWDVVKGRKNDAGAVATASGEASGDVAMDQGVEELRRKLVELEVARGVAKRISGFAKEQTGKEVEHMRVRRHGYGDDRDGTMEEDRGDVVAVYTRRW